MKKIVFLTGAGISAESGIPTFRDAANGLWENHNVDDVATALAIKEYPEQVYKFMNELRNKYKDCKPNYAHKAIAELEKDYNVVVITQNVDTLHEQAGSTNVIHLHGQLNKVRSVNDENIIFDYDKDLEVGTMINGHYVRPHIVLFGESVPNIETAKREICDADICVVIGTSFNVYPAAGLVGYVDSDNPIYYIDPNPAPTLDYPDIQVIKAVATKGVEELISKLKENE